jgi:hypothetical protein
LQGGQPIIVNVTGTGVDAIPGSNAAVAVLNIAGVVGSAPTYLSVFPTTPSGTCAYTGSHAPPFSTLNLAAGGVVANRVMVGLGPAAPGGADTSVCVYSAAGTIDIYMDANGWYGKATAATGYQYQAVGPTRVCDTRPTSGVRCSGPELGPGASELVKVAGVYGIPSGTPVVQAVIGNLTAVLPSQATFLTLYPGDVSLPLASDINAAAGAVLANLVVVKLDTSDSAIGDVWLYNGAGNVNAILDIEGWFQ